MHRSWHFKRINCLDLWKTEFEIICSPSDRTLRYNTLKGIQIDLFYPENKYKGNWCYWEVKNFCFLRTSSISDNYSLVRSYIFWLLQPCVRSSWYNIFSSSADCAKYTAKLLPLDENSAKQCCAAPHDNIVVIKLL